MGRNSRSRKVQQKKKAAAAERTGTGDINEAEVSGSLMSMREGLKKVAGTGGDEEAKTGGASILIWIVLGVIIVAIIMMVAR